MAEAHDVEKILYQNLEDAGVSPADADRCVLWCRSGKTKEAQKLLMQHRHSLLESVHRQQKQIDRLDFLTSSMSKPGFMESPGQGTAGRPGAQEKGSRKP